jgi:hypothetical protein
MLLQEELGKSWKEGTVSVMWEYPSICWLDLRKTTKPVRTANDLAMT